jgi:peptidoglycan/LPS O-acetylase OafA/YrhL
VTIATLLSIIMSIFPPAGYLTRADNTHFANWFIVYLFFVGVVFAQYSDRIVVSFPLFLASGLMYVLGMTLRIPDAISCVFLVYCVVCIGAVKMSWFDSIVTKDYSYGIYLYGYPIAQAIVFALIQLGIFHQNMITTAFVMASALTITICCAAFSWAYVEKPFLRLKRHIL